MQLNVAICDDEQQYLNQLEAVCREILEPDYQLEIIASTSAPKLMMRAELFHLAILDVQLSEPLEGIQLARFILLRNPTCRVIFVSGYTSVVSDVYEIPHVCLVLKEQLSTKMPKFLRLAASEVVKEAAMSIKIQSHRVNRNLILNQVAFMERRKHNTYITMISGEQIVIREKLSSLLNRTSNPYFCRCHVSYAVNLRQVTDIQNACLVMYGGEKVPISRSYEKDVREAYSYHLMQHL